MPSSKPTGPEHPIEQNHFALYVLCKQGELKPREQPRLVNDLKGISAVFIDFEAVPGEEFRLFVRHDSAVDASADLSFEGRSLGKWSIAHNSAVWHNIAGDSLFNFQDSYDCRSMVYETSTFEIRFQYLSRVSQGGDRDVLVPTAVRKPSLEDRPGWVQPSDELMKSQFEVVEDDPFLTFVISMHPPPSSPRTTNSPFMTSSQPTTPSSLLTTSSLPTTSTLSTASPVSTASTLSTTSTLFTTGTLSTPLTPPTPTSPLLTPFPLITPSPSVLTQLAAHPEPAPASTLLSGYGPAISLTRPASISRMTSLQKMSDDELREALSEYEKSSLLLPPRLTPGFRGKLPMQDFCRRYELPEDIPLLLAQMGIKDAHGLSSKRLSDLRNKGMTPRSIKMLQLAVIRFSSESGS